MKKYKNKFFDKIGYSSKNSISSFVFGMKNDKRAELWKKQRRKWGGYDSRVSWTLNTLLLETLYTWLKIYLKEAGRYIDLTHHTFEIHNNILTEKECIIRMLEDLKFALTNLENDEMSENVKDKVRDCFYVLGECFFSLWC